MHSEVALYAWSNYLGPVRGGGAFLKPKYMALAGRPQTNHNGGGAGGLLGGVPAPRLCHFHRDHEKLPQGTFAPEALKHSSHFSICGCFVILTVNRHQRSGALWSALAAIGGHLEAIGGRWWGVSSQNILEGYSNDDLKFL
jgi:hypothetical protein